MTLAVLFLIANAGQKYNGPQLSLPTTPDKTTVAVMPLGNRSGIGNQEDQADLVASGLAQLRDCFSRRGFKVLPQEEVNLAVKDCGFMPDDRDYWNTQSVAKVGKRLQADYVLFEGISDITAQKTGGFLINASEVWVTANVWFIDASGSPILKNFKVKGRSSTNLGGELDNVRERTKKALAVTNDRWSAGFLSNLPAQSLPSSLYVRFADSSALKY